MKSVKLIETIIPFLFLIPVNIPARAQPEGRSDVILNKEWKFFKGDLPDAQVPGFDDSGWRTVNLPHDWSIEGPFSKSNYSCTGYLPGGIGWYRKSLVIPAEEAGRKVFIYFEGVYNNSEVWINGRPLGKRPNGYVSFQYDLTPFVNFGTKNLIAVRVDHTEFGDSRWYTGSGIYRNVHLITTEPVHIAKWGVAGRTTELDSSRAVLLADVALVNETRHNVTVRVVSSLRYGNKVITKTTSRITLGASEDKTISQILNIVRPKLWDIDKPELYTLATEVIGREVLDNVVTPVGFRTTRFDPGKGFFLNGRNLKLKGICMHHDAGALGSAVPAEEWARRLDILKDMGCNAIRTSHNPVSPGFLDLCDEKGFLVIGEAFDEWELPKKKWLTGWNVGTPGKEGYAKYFGEWAVRDLRDFVMRDRNHPSVIMWSIGNEVDYPNDPYTHEILDTEGNPQTWAKFSKSLPYAARLGEVAKELVAVVKSIDTTRPVTAGLASALMSNEVGYANALDVVGYNYQENRYAADHKKYPERPLYGSENGMTLEMWNYVADNNYVMGQFLWTGFEYLGEAGRFPSRSNTAGVIDLAGNRKPEFFFRQSLWSDRPMVFIGTSDPRVKSGPDNLWSHKRVDPVWRGEPGKTISVSVFTNCPEAELYLNDRSLGTKKASDFKNRVLSWDVPFEKGVLKAIGKDGGNIKAECTLVTAGDPAMIKASCDKEALRSDAELAHVFIEVTDESGNLVYNAENEITCEITGPVRLLGMEDSNPSNTEDYKDNSQHAFHGRLLVYLQPAGETGKAIIKLTSPGLSGAEIVLDINKETP